MGNHKNNLLKPLGTLFMETSAKTAAGVHDAFVEVVRKVSTSYLSNPL